MSDVLQETRIKMQSVAKHQAELSNYNCAIIATVGFGKGKVMLDIAQELISKYNIKRILYACDSERLRDSIEDGFPSEIEKWGNSKLKKMITLECYQTCSKWKNEEFDLLLADEADFSMTPVYSNLYFNNKFKFKILVTGTLSSDKKKILQQIVPITFKLTTNQAEDLGIINKTSYYVYNYKLSDDESVMYNKLSAKIFRKIQEEDKNGERFFIGKRREFLFTLDSSYFHCRKIMKWLWSQNKKTRLIVFCQRTEQADRVCKYSYHGKNESLDNIRKFQNEEISACSVVSKIKRGINLRNANAGIFESFDGSTTEFEQRNGRLKRLPQYLFATVIFMIPWVKKTDNKTGKEYYKETIVADWLHKCTANIKDINLIDLKL